MRPVGPEVPPSLAPLLKEMQDAIKALQAPGAPVRLPRIDTVANLPNPDDPRAIGKVAIVDELNCIVVSTLVAGSWDWKRADGSNL